MYSMAENRRDLLKTGLAALAGSRLEAAGRTIPVALVQFDSVPEQVDRNVSEVERLAGQAVESGARWVMFHEGTLCDYTSRLKELAQPVPDGAPVRQLEKLARKLKCYLSYGLSEADHGRYHITQVFTGPGGFIYRYRKTWIWHDTKDANYRDEWVRYDPGTGPEIFTLDGVRATCFICADGEARRCIDRAAALRPQVVFYPNNRHSLPELPVFGERAKAIGAPMLVTNRTGYSWKVETLGGCVGYSATGEVVAKANREGKEEILRFDLNLA